MPLKFLADALLFGLLLVLRQAPIVAVSPCFDFGLPQHKAQILLCRPSDRETTKRSILTAATHAFPKKFLCELSKWRIPKLQIFMKAFVKQNPNGDTAQTFFPQAIRFGVLLNIS